MALSESRPADGDVLMRVVGLDKSYGGLKAVDSVTFDVYRGEVLALVGDNGGRQVDPHQGHRRRPAAGRGPRGVRRGRPFGCARRAMRMPRASDACIRGLGLVDTLDVPENVFLGRELRTRVSRPRAAARSRTRCASARSSSSIDSGSICRG